MIKAKNKNSQYQVGYLDLVKKLNSGKKPNNILLFTNEKILLDELISLIAKNFTGEAINSNNIKTFFSDEKNIEGVLNECSNFSFFSDKKIVVLKILKRAGTKGGFTNQERQALINYINNNNPEVILLLVVIDKEFNFDAYSDFINKNLTVYQISPVSDKDFIDWIKIKFTGYKITNDTIHHLIQFVNPSYDEINSEIEKLKTYCIDSKEITADDVNLCVGFSRDFNEIDFLQAVLTKNYNEAIRIYNRLTLKEDVEIYLVSLLSSSMISIGKLFDPNSSGMNEFALKRELKLWWKDSDKRLRILKEYKSKINELKLKQALDYIYQADKSLKSISSENRKTILTNLIYALTNL